MPEALGVAAQLLGRRPGEARLLLLPQHIAEPPVQGRDRGLAVGEPRRGDAEALPHELALCQPVHHLNGRGPPCRFGFRIWGGGRRIRGHGVEAPGQVGRA